MDEIQVLLAVNSPMLRELLREMIQREADLAVVGEVSDPVDLLVAVGATQADVVIHTWPDSNRMPGICSHLLAEYPELLLIGLPESADRAVACRQVIHRRDVSVSGLGDVLTKIRRTIADVETIHA